MLSKVYVLLYELVLLELEGNIIMYSLKQQKRNKSCIPKNIQSP